MGRSSRGDAEELTSKKAGGKDESSSGISTSDVETVHPRLSPLFPAKSAVGRHIERDTRSRRTALYGAMVESTVDESRTWRIF